MARGKAINPLRMTTKQKQIMKVICAGNKSENGEIVSWCDNDQILERLPYSCSKQAFLCSIRFLKQKGMVESGRREIRRGKKRGILVPTDLGFSVMKPSVPLQIIETEKGFETY